MKERIRKRMLQALSVAIDTAESWIDAETTSLRMRNGKVEYCIGKAARSNVARYERDIAAWRRCQNELSKEAGRS